MMSHRKNVFDRFSFFAIDSHYLNVYGHQTETNKYKEPTKVVKNAAKRQSVIQQGDGGSAPKRPRTEKNSIQLEGDDQSFIRTVRTTTKAKTIDSDLARERAISDALKARVKARPVIKHQFTQRELLEDAIATEVTSMDWNSSRSHVKPFVNQYFLQENKSNMVADAKDG